MILEGAAWDFSLANYESVWFILMQVGIVLCALLAGNALRNLIPFFKKSLIPSSLLGGFLLLLALISARGIMNAQGNAGAVDYIIDKGTMQVFTYHGLGIGFAAMSLKVVQKNKKLKVGKVFENGALIGGTYLIQAIFGLAITLVIYSLTKGTDKMVFYDSGIILPLGFGQGPGNALTWDLIFSDKDFLIDGVRAFEGNGSFGLTIASIGFIVASVIGVIYININKKRGLIQERKLRYEDKDVSHYESENEIDDTDSVDKFSIQLGLVIFAYVLAFLFMLLLALTKVDLINSLAWGFNFIWAVITANLIKLLLKVFKKKGVVKKNYINNYQMDRISGFAFDFMIVSGVAAIEIDDVKKYVLPIILLCAVGTIVTFAYVKIVAKYRFKECEHEVFVTNFGALTGTASNGMILLKEIDPNFETQASDLYVTSQLPAMLFVAPMLLLLDFSSKSFNQCLITFGIFIALFIAYNLFMFRDKIFKFKKQTE